MLSVHHYPKTKAYGDDFEAVRQYLLRHNENYKNIHFHWSRFEWMFARSSFAVERLIEIIMIKENQTIRALLTFEDEENVLFLVFDDDDSVKQAVKEVIINQHITADLVCIADKKMVSILQALGYEKIDWIDPVTRFDVKRLEIKEIEGVIFTSLEEDYRLDQIHTVLWRGFDHGDKVIYSEETLEDRLYMTSSPHFEKKYTFVAQVQDQYVSYSGIWYQKGTKTALIEPVATVPEHRKRGLARACIYRAINAAIKDGATDIFVASNRDVYLNMGFTPFDQAIRLKKKG